MLDHPPQPHQTQKRSKQRMVVVWNNQYNCSEASGFFLQRLSARLHSKSGLNLKRHAVPDYSRYTDKNQKVYVKVLLRLFLHVLLLMEDCINIFTSIYCETSYVCARFGNNKSNCKKTHKERHILCLYLEALQFLFVIILKR